MPDNITITSVIGPGLAITAAAFQGIKSVTFDLERQVLTVYTGLKTLDVSLSSITTVTYTISSGVATIVVS